MTAIPMWAAATGDDEDPVVLNRWNGIPTVSLTATPAGVRLSWIFDESDQYIRELLVLLSDDEAQAVFDTDTGTGLLENVRPSLTHPVGVIKVLDGDSLTPLATSTLTIPPGCSEREFVELLDGASDGLLRLLQ